MVPENTSFLASGCIAGAQVHSSRVAADMTWPVRYTHTLELRRAYGKRSADAEAGAA